MIVLGIDLSIRSTGIAGTNWAETITAPSLTTDATHADHWHRIRHIRQQLVPYIDAADLVVIEGPSYGSNDPGAHERAHLWWWTVGRCINHDRPVAVVQPSTLKVYATGNGRASKDDVVAETARRRPNIAFRGNDQADALCLAAMGLDHLGCPPVALPATHRRALQSVHWPDIRAAA